jgi:histidinol phosphatase-like PHP family hydrolase
MDAAGPTFDLQSHSVHSDGVLSAAGVVAAAAAAGVELLALTDHDIPPVFPRHRTWRGRS